jgi:hypothetical protein
MTMICEEPSYSLAQHEPIGIYYWPINVRRNIFSLALGSPQDRQKRQPLEGLGGKMCFRALIFSTVQL